MILVREAIYKYLITPIKCFKLISASLRPNTGPLLSNEEGRPYLSGPGYYFWYLTFCKGPPSSYHVLNILHVFHLP
jgi:hypothetical protein